MTSWSSDPLHEVSGPDTVWTTVNTGENFPGVATPLGWTFWRERIEIGTRLGFCELGAIPRGETRFPPSMDDRAFSVVRGRFVANVTTLRAIADNIPGNSGDSLEEQMFGIRPPAGAESRRSVGRYPVIAVKFPLALTRVTRRLEALRAEGTRWWRHSTRPEAVSDRARASAVLRDAAEHFLTAMHWHSVATMLGTAFSEQIDALARAGGHPELRTALMSGYGGTEETKTVAHLWRVSRGRATLEDFLADHGYHSSVEAEISSVSWREDPAPVRRTLGKFSAMPDSASPDTGERRQIQARLAAERAVLADLARSKRPGGRAVLRLGRHFIPLRETGKASFVQAIDVGRAAARALGRHLTDDGILRDPHDVYFLTMDELTGTLPREIGELVAFRRRRYEDYRATDLPERWVGDPAPIPVATATTGVTELAGVGVSAGVAEGAARVFDDPDTDDLDVGEILVCHTTDPSWASLFHVAGGVVVDVGGAMSHGAIVAREMGIPCVINTRTGTRLIRDGERIRIDGGAGTVEFLDRVGDGRHDPASTTPEA